MVTVTRESGFLALKANMKKACKLSAEYDPKVSKLPLEEQSRRLFDYCTISELGRMTKSSNESDYLVVSLIDTASGYLIGFGIAEVVDSNRLNKLLEEDYGSDELNVILRSPALVIHHLVIVPTFRSNNYSNVILTEFASLGLPAIVNTTSDSEDFWFKKGFIDYFDSNWLTSPNFFPEVTYHG